MLWPSSLMYATAQKILASSLPAMSLICLFLGSGLEHWSTSECSKTPLEFISTGAYVAFVEDFRYLLQEQDFVSLRLGLEEIHLF